jgi:hypothetical protein
MNEDPLELARQTYTSIQEEAALAKEEGREFVVFSRRSYLDALSAFDAAVCEASAVGQKQAGKMAAANVGYATYVYAQMCGTGISMIRAAPLSRWVYSNFENWHFGGVAGHARAILEGYLLFVYLIEKTGSEDEMKARVNVMYLNDCSRRIDLFKNTGLSPETVENFEKQREEIRGRLTGNAYFSQLPSAVQKSCLSGKFLMISSRDEMLEKIAFPKNQFNAIFDLYSQHTHILPLSFHRMEPNGRGTGLENDVDRSYIGQALHLCAEILSAATDEIQEQFPDVVDVRKGIKSIFSPGPRSNRR